MLKDIYARLEKSDVFQNFKSANPDSFLCAGFFIMNFKSGVFDYSFDFRNDKQIFSFKIPEHAESAIVMQVDDILDSKKSLEKINLDIQVDLSDLREIVERELVNHDIKNKLEEIIAVLQVLDSQKVWNLTCMCEGFTIISCHIHSETSGILKFEKKNLLDFVKKP